MTEDDLEELRHRIDEINRQILDLLARRGVLVEQVGALKARLGLETYDPQREEAVLQELVAANPGPYSGESIRLIFEQIFRASQLLQERQTRRHLLAWRGERSTATVIEVKGVRIGGGRPVVIAGPCAIESREQLATVAREAHRYGAAVLRGGAFKPRTSPHSFQGLGEEGLRYLKEVAAAEGMPAVSEVLDAGDVELVAAYADILQIGARNMHNPVLLRAVAAAGKPVLLKRGFMATIEELLYAAEYVMAEGNEEVILCERGIRTFEHWTRNTLDISAVAVLKQESHLPVIVDVSHSAGRRDIIIPLARAALGAGADGIMVEVHPNPLQALSDAAQQIDLAQFRALMASLAPFLNEPQQGEKGG